MIPTPMPNPNFSKAGYDHAFCASIAFQVTGCLISKIFYGVFRPQAIVPIAAGLAFSYTAIALRQKALQNEALTSKEKAIGTYAPGGIFYSTVIAVTIIAIFHLSRRPFEWGSCLVTVLMPALMTGETDKLVYNQINHQLDLLAPKLPTLPRGLLTQLLK